MFEKDSNYLNFVFFFFFWRRERRNNVIYSTSEKWPAFGWISPWVKEIFFLFHMLKDKIAKFCSPYWLCERSVFTPFDYNWSNVTRVGERIMIAKCRKGRNYGLIVLELFTWSSRRKKERNTVSKIINKAFLLLVVRH